MAEQAAVRKFIPRAPRYVLRPTDRNVMRMGLARLRGSRSIKTTTLLNLSETGVAFLMKEPCDLCVGDELKVEIPVPSGDQIAWWARVVRLQEYPNKPWFFSDVFGEEREILVALKFENLPKGHSEALRKGIEQSFLKILKEQRERTWLYYRTLFMQNLVPILVYTLLTAAAIGFIAYFAQPDENYDPKRGAPWGQRYKFF